MLLLLLLLLLGAGSGAAAAAALMLMARPIPGTIGTSGCSREFSEMGETGVGDAVAAVVSVPALTLLPQRKKTAPIISKRLVPEPRVQF